MVAIAVCLMVMIIITTTIMAETSAPRALLRLLSWLSPAFPVGAFAYSHGVEHAIHSSLIKDRRSLQDWLSDILAQGSGWNDALLFTESHRLSCSASYNGLARLSELAEAMAGCAERHQETMLQGDAFVAAARAWPHEIFEQLPDRIASPVAVGAITAAHGIVCEAGLTAYLHAFLSNLIQGAIRLVPLGQSDGLAVLAAIEEEILLCSRKALAASLDDLGGCAVISDIMAIRHETQYSRVFRS